MGLSTELFTLMTYSVVVFYRCNFFNRYFYVVALKLTEYQETVSSDNYDEIDLLNFSRMQNKTKPKPYIAAVFTSSGVGESTFILGDGRITDYPTSRTTSYYYNGPLEPGTSYKIFQRIVINEEV
jgi:hypothetical protein